MAHKYQIKLNPQKMSSEKIARHQDFDALLEQFESRQADASTAPKSTTARIIPLSAKRWLYLSGAAVAASLVILFVWPALQGGSQVDEAAYFAARPFIDPPELAQIDQNAEVVTVNVNQGGVYEYPTGSRLVVPAAAFANDRGQLIEGEVEVYYRELHDHVDFFVDGVPMSYDSAATRYILESGGMVEVYAEQNGERLQLVPGKTIEVTLVSEMIIVDPAILQDYKVYQLDTAARNWRYRSIPLSSQLSNNTSSDERVVNWEQDRSALEAAYRQEVAELEAEIKVPLQPIRPEKSTGNRPTLELNFLQGDIRLASGSDITPEQLQQLHAGAIWEISPSSPPIDIRAFQVEWEEVRLRNLPRQEYELTLINPGKEERLIIHPALLGSAYERAMEQYQVDQKAYEAALAERESQLAGRLADIDQRYAQERNDLEEQIRQELNQLPTKKQKQLSRRQVIHQFVADHFGLWQVARPLAATERKISARFLDEAGNEIEQRTVYLADDSRNTVYRYLAADGNSIQYDPQSAHLMWLVGEDGQVRILRPEAFSEIREADDQFTFVLKKATPPIRSEADLRAVLSFE